MIDVLRFSADALMVRILTNMVMEHTIPIFTEEMIMSFTIYDCRRDIRDILIAPQIRARFCRFKPASGSHDQFHTHDLGHEIFIILSGGAEFKISGETRELGPGQMCYALADELHSVRALGDEPVYMYLSVTPHIQPTHTFYSEDGEQLPPWFRPSSDYS